jgi:hypothetical protein
MIVCLHQQCNTSRHPLAGLGWLAGWAVWLAGLPGLDLALLGWAGLGWLAGWLVAGCGLGAMICAPPPSLHAQFLCGIDLVAACTTHQANIVQMS